MSTGPGTAICMGLPTATWSWDVHPAPTQAAAPRLVPMGPVKLPSFGQAVPAPEGFAGSKGLRVKSESAPALHKGIPRGKKLHTTRTKTLLAFPRLCIFH